VDAPSPAYLLTRSAYVVGLLVVVLLVSGFIRKIRRQSAIFAQLESITSDSSFYHQFYAADARKSLIRAIALIAEADTIGVTPEQAINRAMGIRHEFFANEASRQELTVRQKIISNCLRGNYENFVKLGYLADSRTLAEMRNGELPPIPTGPHAGRKPVIATLIDPAISPGLDRVIPNLAIRPPPDEGAKPTDFEIAASKQLARDLADAGFIEGQVSERILDALSEAGSRTQ
jgi:hypothetical protein